MCVLELEEPSVILTTKQNSDSKKSLIIFNTDRLFVQQLRDKPETTKLSITIKYDSEE